MGEQENANAGAEGDFSRLVKQYLGAAPGCVNSSSIVPLVAARRSEGKASLLVDAGLPALGKAVTVLPHSLFCFRSPYLCPYGHTGVKIGEVKERKTQISTDVWEPRENANAVADGHCFCHWHQEFTVTPPALCTTSMQPTAAATTGVGRA